MTCDSKGGYKPVQCHRGTPFCWCVDKYGREVPRTRTSGKPKCGPMGNYLNLFYTPYLVMVDYAMTTENLRLMF